MPFFAKFDPSAPDPQPVLGWFHTGAVNYHNLPPPEQLLPLTEEQWTTHMITPGQWTIVAGVLTPPQPMKPPKMNVKQRARAALRAGVTIAASGALTFSTVFAADPDSLRKIINVLTVISATKQFPNGDATYPLSDVNGKWYNLTLVQYNQMAVALVQYAATLDLIADGNPRKVTSLPAATINLVF